MITNIIDRVIMKVMGPNQYRTEPPVRMDEVEQESAIREGITQRLQEQTARLQRYIELAQLRSHTVPPSTPPGPPPAPPAPPTSPV